jgi:hypothetical protein
MNRLRDIAFFIGLWFIGIVSEKWQADLMEKRIFIIREKF